MNVAIIGCGGMGGHHARFAQNCGLEALVENGRMVKKETLDPFLKVYTYYTTKIK